jgi:hypothetical protein
MLINKFKKTLIEDMTLADKLLKCHNIQWLINNKTLTRHGILMLKVYQLVLGFQYLMHLPF